MHRELVSPGSVPGVISSRLVVLCILWSCSMALVILALLEQCPCKGKGVFGTRLQSSVYSVKAYFLV